MQYPIYSQYLVEGLFINPAHGTREALSLSFQAAKGCSVLTEST
ncbi:MAG: hypothetical protein R2727_07320 [Bacteroidales bacterium]